MGMYFTDNLLTVFFALNMSMVHNCIYFLSYHVIENAINYFNYCSKCISDGVGDFHGNTQKCLKSRVGHSDLCPTPKWASILGRNVFNTL